MAKKHEILLSLIQGETGGVHPLISLARIAKRSEANGDDSLAFQCYKELSNYVAPKLKSVELQVDQQEIRPITIIISEETQRHIEEARETPLVEAEPLGTEDPMNQKFRNVKKIY